MASKKTKKQGRFAFIKKINRCHFKAIAWAIFAVHQGFMSWLVLTNFNNYFAVVGAVMSFGLAIIALAMVGACFVKASNNNNDKA